MNHDLLLILFGLMMGLIWAAAERSLRKATEENYQRAIKDAEFWRGYILDRKEIAAEKRKIQKQ